MSESCCSPASSKRPRPDYLFWGGLTLCGAALLLHVLSPADWPTRLVDFSHQTTVLLKTMSWGLVAGIVAMGLMHHVPREMVIALLGPGGRWSGLLRATGAGLLLDACNHGILMVAMKLYERGASPGQVFAFLIASPWNSLSLTLILAALVGWGWTLAFIAGSALVALSAGALCDALVRQGKLPANPHTRALPQHYHLGREIRDRLRGFRPSLPWVLTTLTVGLKESRMVLRWIFLGTLLTALLRVVVPDEIFQNWLGPGAAGLAITLLAATVIEVCSEGSTPLAADLLNRAGAPGGGFVFLMAGASTDATELLVLRETTGSWKFSLALPLLTVPQILLLGWLMNHLGTSP